MQRNIDALPTLAEILEFLERRACVLVYADDQLESRAIRSVSDKASNKSVTKDSNVRDRSSIEKISINKVQQEAIESEKEHQILSYFSIKKGESNFQNNSRIYSKG